VSLNLATTWGGGALISSGNSRSIEVGAVYAPDGRFGCYFTTCEGVESNADITSYGTIGFYDDYGHVAGSSIASVEAASVGPVGFSTAQIFSGMLIGTADYFSLGASILPISVGVYQCTTTLDTVIGIPPPTPTPTSTSAPTATPTLVVCAGDCDGSGRVTVDDLILAVNIALGQQLLGRCRSLDADHDGVIAINELIRAVAYALDGCPGAPA
jgi:hypothetical protein